jgi:polyhydroxyalkanoate synthesis regulator phasin
VASGREQYLQALASLSDLTRTQAERVAALLAKQGEVQSAQVGRVAEDLMRRTQKNREIMSRLVQREVKRQLGVLGMATRDEVARLQQRVRALEQELERANKAAASSAAAATEAPAATAKPRSSGRTTKATSTTRSASGATKPSTRTRTAGASSRSTATSPSTRRRKNSGSTGSGSGSTGPGSPGSGTRSTGSRSGGSGSTGSADDGRG